MELKTLCIKVKANEEVQVGEVLVYAEPVTSNCIKLVFRAPEHIQISRESAKKKLPRDRRSELLRET